MSTNRIASPDGLKLSLGSPEQFFTAIERPITITECFDIVNMIVDRLQAKTLVMTSGDGDVLEENSNDVILSMLYEMDTQVGQLKQVLDHAKVEER